jgi:hypothetical protein
MRRIRMFEAAGQDYRQVSMFEKTGIEEMSEGEKDRLSEMLGEIGFELNEEKKIHRSPYIYDYFCAICDGDEDSDTYEFCPGICYSRSCDMFVGTAIELPLNHMLIVSRTVDDYWQVQLIIIAQLRYKAEKMSEARFRCDDWRGLVLLMTEIVAPKVGKVGKVEEMFRDMLNLDL